MGETIGVTQNSQSCIPAPSQEVVCPWDSRSVSHTTVRAVGARLGPLSLRPQAIQNSETLSADPRKRGEFNSVSALQILDCEEPCIS